MNDEPITSRELIAAYRSHGGPTAAARERMLRAIQQPRREPPVLLAPRRRASIAWIALAAMLALVGLSAYLLAGARHDAHVAPAEMMMAPQITPPSTDAVTTAPPQPVVEITDRPQDPPADPPPHHAPIVDTPADPPRPRAAPRQAGDQVLAELALIQSIKEALDADQPRRALTLVDRHTRSFARGTLIEEREALRVVALCAADDATRGLRAQHSFLRAYPRSAYADRVRGACPADDAPHFP